MASARPTSRTRRDRQVEAAEPIHTESDDDSDIGWFSRERSLALALVGMLAICLYICYLLALPFLSAIAWAGALAVVMHPLHSRLERRTQRPSVAAAISVVLAATAVVGPAYFILQALIRQAAEGLQNLTTHADSIVSRYPSLQPYWERISAGQVPEEAKDTVREFAGNVPTYLTGSIWVGAQLLITFFMLFYFLRDRRDIARTLTALLPLTRTEVRRTMRRTEDTIFASIYGSLTVAVVQGTLGGLMFWMLDLPTPVLWGVVMAFLATIPMLGTFVVWMPAAIFLALEGEWWRAAILVTWGAVAIGLIDNILYPVLVGKRMRLHPLPVFVAVVGGITLFGAAGIVLGPVVLSITEALLDVWQRRTADGGTIEAGAESC
ncbi:MAG: AI-2E family transporter [Planctomycetales bacterium]|nr:AI-2E family transporter [Planctomycetales bacterium]MBN8625086.1 AI-2E family transporter [Planctomycetota bacterium]